MSDDPSISLEALEREEARLRERLAKIALVKNLLSELALSPTTATPPPATPSPATAQSQVQPEGLPQVAPDSAPIVDARTPAFDGTFRGLVSTYRQDERSPYHQLKHKVRQNYDSALKRLIDDVGSERVADWNAERIKAVYDNSWAAGGKIAMGRSMTAKLRLLCSFGSTVLDDDPCTRLSAILSNMRIPNAKPKDGERLSREHARAIRIAAREHFGWDSIALATALQFEFPKLRQVDVIGEWVPLRDSAESEIIKGSEKWIRGLKWSDIDDNMILRRILPSRRPDLQKEVQYSLRRSQMTMEEINRIPLGKRNGPMIICEFSGLPWSGNEFRRKWRMVADKAGVPKSVRNMDSHGKAADGEPELGADTAL